MEGNQRFDTFEQWVNKASSWLTRHANYSDKPHDQFRAFCFDSLGRRCAIGADFHRARDEDAFPVHWVWPDQMGQLWLDNQVNMGAKNALYMRYLGMATILGEAMAHISDEDIRESATAAFLDLAETCPNIKVTQVLKRFDLTVREDAA